MHPAFHLSASFIGYAAGELRRGTQFLFDWIDGNGPAPSLDPRITRIEIIESIASAHLEIQNWSGRNAGENGHYSNVFTVLKIDGEKRITHKPFHSHVT